MSDSAQQNVVGSGTLLPYNATKLERTIEHAIKYDIDTSILSGFKFKTTGDNINMALSWEYSLSPINIDDFRIRVIEGLKFHRLQGTVYSLRQAFSWYGFTNIKIEEEIPGEHFAEFQVGVEEIPNNLDIEKIISVAELAAPLRSRLSRMYNDLYDVRRFVLGESDWGNFLSDHSGNRIYEGSPKFSFGRVNNFATTANQPNFKFYIVRVHYAYARKIDEIYRLDWSILSESGPGEHNYDMTRQAHRYMSNSNFVCDDIDHVFKTRSVARALPVLSEDAVLGDINTCFSCGYETVDETPFELSYNYLSEHSATRSQILVAYREFREHTSFAVDDSGFAAVRGYKTNITFLTYSHSYAIKSYGWKSRFISASYEGNNIWHDQIHFDVSWRDQANNLGKIVQ